MAADKKTAFDDNMFFVWLLMDSREVVSKPVITHYRQGRTVAQTTTYCGKNRANVVNTPESILSQKQVVEGEHCREDL